MSIHSSLRGHRGSGVKHRNVLSREERLVKLSGDGRWNDGKSLFALPKVRSIKIAVKKKKKEADDASGADAKKKK
jgi:small basic protein (TIGR04137 family)